jgi:hypothetical protein
MLWGRSIEMSMDLYVFINHGSTLTVLEWQQAIDANHLPLLLDKNANLKQLRGFLGS